ncbi:MAG TPA: glycosyltransferase [Verrucomicrobiae bacterium]|jgi:glycosyltransferase involved in cell wall biosynthesis|nr:glycosyltransferase [Verrucomicrobiae bacterium]
MRDVKAVQQNETRLTFRPMKVSGFTFVRNGNKLGYPFVQSIRSILPIMDEFIVALGPSNDGTEEALRAIDDPKIRIIPTQWNERIRGDYSIKGFIYGQQKSIALFNCTGDWAFYLEGDEIVHEDELPKIRAAMEKYLNDERVEALVFDYLHFYGNANTYAWSPRWYRTAPRILRNTIPAWAPKGLFFTVLETHKKSRYPRAAHAGATIYHYGWVRPQEQMNLKTATVDKIWNNNPSPKMDYAEIDPKTLRRFAGTHPKVIQSWLEPADGIFQANPNHQLNRREKKHRIMLALENGFGFRFNKKHYRRVG